jgi:hypothetical protein
MKKMNLEGSVFIVPLLKEGYGLGLVARHYKHGTLFYFFKDKLIEKINLTPLDKINKENILWVTLAGDAAFTKKTWTVLGVLDNWKKEDWPVPVFKTTDILRGFPIAVYYDEKLEEIERKKITEKESSRLQWQNGIAGTGFVEDELSELLENSSSLT